ncbi:hypothetical protein [Xanthomonas citri]|uniref:hypothetical protein n=1 Tax=Xanthomonas citri TaxID=346 RepID=UPI000538E0B1|nr:hypothetical protein [Xanthomonas citri]KGU42929.1 hypothetical protein NY97_15900 [Xanthomonas citri pv. fuscans]KIJ01212.1 hypothetical protein ST33_08875 [Xanthomonas citri pv. fuscans]QWN03898.1 hypothetical protein DGN16_12780 [Xanthomonas citri pv. fuscans]QWN12325.1 hypothetical protein DGN07_12875 [Xanthomonas citri pv. fuscans]
MIYPQSVPSDVLAVLLAVAEGVQRERRARLARRLLLAAGMALCLLSLAALAPSVHASAPSLSDALECRLPTAQAETVLADYGIPTDGKGVQFGTLVTAFDIPVMKIEAVKESGILHLYYVIVADALRPFIDAAGMQAGGPGFVRSFLHQRNSLHAITPTEVRQRGALMAPIHCEMRA